MKENRGQVTGSFLVFFLCIGIFVTLILFQLTTTRLTLLALLACIFFVVAFFNSKLALSALILSMLLSPELARNEIAKGRELMIRMDDVILLIVFLGWMAKMAINKKSGLLKKTFLNTPIFLYILICLISSFLAIIQGRISAAYSFFFNLKYIEYFCLFFMVVNNVEDIKQAKVYTFLILLTSLLVSIYALKSFSVEQRVSAPFETGGGGEPNTLAGYLIFVMALILGFILYSKSRRQRIMLVMLFGFILIPFMRTLSRSGWLSFFPMVLTAVFFTRKFKTQLIIILIVGALLSPRFFSKQVRNRIKDTFTPYKQYSVMGKKIYLDASTSARFDTMDMALEKFSKHPILGNGVPIGTVVDNQYARILCETGALGIIVFLWLILLLFKLGIRSFTDSTGDFSRAISLGFIAGLSGLLFHSLGASTFIIIRIMEPFWFIAGILAVLPEIQEAKIEGYD